MIDGRVVGIKGTGYFTLNFNAETVHFAAMTAALLVG
jgi:hypothetical protein